MPAKKITLAVSAFFALALLSFLGFRWYRFHEEKRKQVEFFVRVKAGSEAESWQFVNTVAGRTGNPNSVKDLLRYTRFLMPDQHTQANNRAFFGSFSIGALSDLPKPLPEDSKREISEFCEEIFRKDTGSAEWEVSALAAIRISRKHVPEVFSRYATKYQNDSRSEVRAESSKA